MYPYTPWKSHSPWKNRPSQKETIILQPSIFQVLWLLVSGRVLQLQFHLHRFQHSTQTSPWIVTRRGTSWALRIFSTASCTSWNGGKHHLIPWKNMLLSKGNKDHEKSQDLWMFNVMPERYPTLKVSYSDGLNMFQWHNDIHKLNVLVLVIF